jgi:hypothetical protein
MNLQENIFRIKEMMGLVTEQSITLPTTITDSYTAANCDELHAFQSTGGKVIGNMNVTVGDKLKEIYDSGVNPKVTKVTVKVQGMTVTWSVTIDKSNDGKAWVGFTSRGAGCNQDIVNRAESASYGNDIQTAKSKIESTYDENGIDIEKVNDFIFNGGQNSFRQIFYRYTKPNKNQPHNGGQTTPNQNPNQKIIKKILHNNDPDKLRTELKGLGVIYNADIISRPEEVIVKYQKTGDNPVSLSFIYSDSGEKEIVLDKVKESNAIERKIDYKINEFDGYIIVIKKEID